MILVNGYEKIPANATTGMDELVFFHTATVAIASVCVCINLALLLIFLTHRHFRRKFQILITLNIADMINCVAILLMGVNRRVLYRRILSTMEVPIRTAWQCAAEPWLWLRLVGDLWPPVVQCLMGLERCLCVFFPIWYRSKHNTRATVLISISISFVAVSLAAGFTIAFFEYRNGSVPYHCGRKAAFSKAYGTYIYLANIFGYLLGLLFNASAYWKVRQLQQNRSTAAQQRKIRYYLAISLISTILVSFPNAISVASSWFFKIDDSIAKPAVWTTLINSSIALFVYIWLNDEFRDRLFGLMPQKWSRSSAPDLGAANQYTGVDKEPSPVQL